MDDSNISANEIEDKFNLLLKDLGIQVTNDRFHNALRKLQTIPDESKIKAMSSKQLLEQHRSLVFAVDDVRKLSLIIEQISIKKDNRELLARKIEEMCTGSSSPMDERRENALGRNTQFELVLLARLRAAGIDCSLGDPNPDILARANGREYGIEAKRLFGANDKSIEKNIRKAAEQLNTSFLDKSDKKRGIIAISVDRYINQTHNVPTLKSQLQMSGISAKLANDFQEKCVRHIKNPEIIKNDRIVSLFVDFSAMAWPEDINEPMSLETLSHNEINLTLVEDFRQDLGTPLARYDMQMQAMMIKRMNLPEGTTVYIDYKPY